MVSRHLAPPFPLVCLTDDRRRHPPRGGVLRLARAGRAAPAAHGGQVAQAGAVGRFSVPGLDHGCAGAVHRPGFGDRRRRWTTTSASAAPSDVYVARNWARPLERLGQTSVFRFPVGGNAHLLADFRADAQGIADKYQFEQHYVTACGHRRRQVLARGLDAALPAALPAAVPAALLRAGQAAGRRAHRHLPRRAEPRRRDGSGRWNKGVPPHPTRWQHLRATFGDGPAGGPTAGCATCSASCCRCRGSRRRGANERRAQADAGGVKIVHLLFTHSFAGTERHAIELANAQAQKP
jgi:hypothetical protein